LGYKTPLGAFVVDLRVQGMDFAMDVCRGLLVVFERLDGEVNWVVTEIGIEGPSGEYSS